MPKKIKVARPEWDGDILKVKYTDGSVAELDTTQLPEAVKVAAFQAGVVNRLFAAFSPAKGQMDLVKKNGQERWAELVAGQFTKPRSGAPSASTLDLLVQAVVLSYADKEKVVDPAKVKPQIEKMGRSERAALKRVPGVAFHFAALTNKEPELDDIISAE